jgi:hypothetical protein
VAALLCLAAPACAPSQTHYVLASTGTVIGVEVAQHPANQTPQAKLGYNRSETAMVPTARPPCAITEDGQVNCGSINPNEKLKDLPDVLMELRYGGIFDLGPTSGIYQRLAVGSTAVAQDGATVMFAKDAGGNLDPAIARTVTPIPSYEQLARSIVDDAAQAENRDELRSLVAKDYASLLPEERQRLEVVTGVVSPNYSRELHEALRSVIGG